jgi:phage tail P2-like protein
MTLTPPNATPLEQALSETGASVNAIPVPLSSLWDPDTCPAHLLPWLAWTLSVDVWSPAWPESVKRQAIRSSAEVHRHKGTRGALRRSLEALDLGRVTISEWHEYGGDPYRFRVDLAVSTRGLSEIESTYIDRAIEAAKNARSHLDVLQLTVESAGAAPTIATAVLSGETITVLPYALTDLDGRSAMPVVAIGFYGVDTMTVFPGA